MVTGDHCGLAAVKLRALSTSIGFCSVPAQPQSLQQRWDERLAAVREELRLTKEGVWCAVWSCSVPASVWSPKHGENKRLMSGLKFPDTVPSIS